MDTQGIEKITIIFPPGDQLSSLFRQKEINTKIEDLLNRLCTLRAIDFNLKKLLVLNDLGESLDLSQTVGESGISFIEICDKKAAKKAAKAEKELKKKEEFVNRGVPPGVQLNVGECCYLTLQEQLFDDEKKALEDIKKKIPDVCDNFSDEFVVSALFARKFNQDRTIETLKKNLQWRKDHGALDLPKFEDIPTEFWKMFVHVPCARTSKGRCIRFVSPGLIQVGVEPWVPQNFRKSLIWLHYVGIFSDGIDGLRNGLHTMVDMENLGWKNFDLEIQKVVTSLLYDNIPILLRGTTILHPPKFFYGLDRIWRSLTKSKVAARVTIGTEKSLQSEIDGKNLLKRYGGELEYDNEKWLTEIKAWNQKNEERLRAPGGTK